MGVRCIKYWESYVSPPILTSSKPVEIGDIIFLLLIEIVIIVIRACVF